LREYVDRDWVALRIAEPPPQGEMREAVNDRPVRQQEAVTAF
jgi:hypothetical protein